MHANHPKIAQQWEKKYKKGGRIKVNAGGYIGSAIKSVKPGTDLGGKTVSQVKMDAAIAKFKSESFNYKEGVKKAIKKMKDIK